MFLQLMNGISCKYKNNLLNVLHEVSVIVWIIQY